MGPPPSGQIAEGSLGLTRLGDLTQWQGGEFLGQRAPKGSSHLGYFIATGLVLFMVSIHWGQLNGV